MKSQLFVHSIVFCWENIGLPAENPLKLIRELNKMTEHNIN